MVIQEPVQAAIWHCLNNYDNKDAVFLSERLCAEVETDETIYLLATSYFRSNMLHQAYWLLKEKARRSPQCRFLQSKCAYQLKKYAEAECALTCIGFGNSKFMDEIVKTFGDIACFALQLAARICIKTERNRIAVEVLLKALKLNPFLWSCFVDLCHLGEDIDATAIFRITSSDVFNTSLPNNHVKNSLILYGDNSSNFASDTQWMNLMKDTSIQNLSNPLLTEGMYNTKNLSSTYNLSTPVDQNITHLNLITPCYNNPNISSTTLRDNSSNPSIQVNNQNNSRMVLLDETALGYMGTPFRKQFKYLSSYVPTTPSFGVLPLSSPGDDTSIYYSLGSTQFSNNNSECVNNTPPTTLVEVNQEQKVIGKKMKSSAGLTHRKDLPVNSGQNKPPVFSQTSNITPRASNHLNNATTINTLGSAAVRRSSRLFGNSSNSVKENNKTPSITQNSKFAQPRSPPRKSKSRISKIAFSNELIEDRSHTLTNGDKFCEKNYKNKEKEKIETITTANAPNRTVEDAKVLFNNSINNVQTYNHHVLALKKHSADGLMMLLRDLGEGYKNYKLFQCKAAIKHLEATIPKHQLCTSWVQSIIAVSYYELREYDKAIQIFKRIHEAEPHRLQYLEIYSSALWHLQREVDLSALTQDLVNQDKSSPITWCVAGNCFSLHKEHDTAIKFFKRAVQVDPEFIYSYTLLGHELVLTEELDKAMDYFRSAVVRDPRHYNAWFGIGTIYSKQEKYELAELHYIKALKVNPQNSVILVHIGAMQYYMQKKELALQTLNTAALLEPKNPLARFHRGSIYYSLGRHQEALQELENLKEIVPKESVVFYLIGKIHKALGNVDLALMHFSWATDLDPKGANNQIKDAFDSMSHPSCCTQVNNTNLEVELDPISDPSDDSAQTQPEYNYDSDVY